ncbi:hypothetical protein [Lentzea aerocolonigenes]|uniref:hypothetical protein n=1 Tax=Lentzea aerocolonigenes TaxID=68170 RepID=UPI0004C46BDE|nr:hypothetical protein [Lentzea aerocolonigenes]MCP2250643.1 hypothetical protein [Lentzea aerocolonigenes]
MRDLLDDDIAELYPVRGSDDVRLARLREQLFTEAPKRRPSRNWVGIAAAVVAVVMITGLVVLLRPAHRDAPATMPVTPATSLQEAATILELAEKPTAKYRHLKYVIWQTITVNQVEAKVAFGATALEFEINVWVPSTNGGVVVIYRKFTGRSRPVAGLQESIERLAQMGDNGPRLWGTFCSATPCKETSLALPLPVDPAQRMEAASSRLLSPFTTNEELAATYRELAATPGIHWENGKVWADGARTSFTIDPATGRVTGSVQDKPAGSPLPDGTASMTVDVTNEWTDRSPN